MKKIVLFALTLGLISCDPQTFNSVLSTLPTPASTPALSNQEVINGLKEALKVETTKAYNTAMTFTGGEKVNTDLKAYVLKKSLDGLFVYVASEESKIRKDPAARVSAILVKVFGQQ